MHILLVEDERKISAYVRKGLEEQGYAVDQAFTGREALDWIGVSAFDLIVLDIMLPGIDGIEVCRTMRRESNRTPVLMLTARDAVDDRVKGLDSGADDYLVKPFDTKELFARCRALLRRTPETERAPIFRLSDLELDTRTRTVRRGREAIELTAKEYGILECLVRDPGRVFTRDDLAAHVWNYDALNQSNVVDVYIRNLRRKIDDPFAVKLIRTVRGIGYSIAEGNA